MIMDWAVRTPWPISELPMYMVTLLSEVMWSHTLGLKILFLSGIEKGVSKRGHGNGNGQAP